MIKFEVKRNCDYKFLPLIPELVTSNNFKFRLIRQDSIIATFTEIDDFMVDENG